VGLLTSIIDLSLSANQERVNPFIAIYRKPALPAAWAITFGES